MDEFHRELKHLQVVLAWTNSQLLKPIGGEENDRAAQGCLDLAIEHGDAICVLCETGRLGLAVALFRIVFEALIRGLWLSSHPEEFKKFKENKMNLHNETNFKKLVAKIELRIGKDHRILSKLSDKAWPIMNAFTHTGYQHIVRRYRDGALGSNYADDELGKFLALTGCFVLLAGATFASYYNDPYLNEQFKQRMQEYARRNLIE